MKIARPTGKQREQRPLLYGTTMQEAPILSDDMPPSFEQTFEEEQETLMKIHQSQQQRHQANSSNNSSNNHGNTKSSKTHNKKRPLLRRLFNKGKGSGGGRQKEPAEFDLNDDNDDYLDANGSLSFKDNHNESLPSSSSPRVIISSQQHQQQQRGFQEEEQEQERDVPSPVTTTDSMVKAAPAQKQQQKHPNISTTKYSHASVASQSMTTTTTATKVTSKQNHKINMGSNKSRMSSNNSNRSTTIAATATNTSDRSTATTPTNATDAVSMYRNGESLINTTSSRTNHTAATTTVSTTVSHGQQARPQQSRPNGSGQQQHHESIDGHKILARPFGREHILSMNQTWLVHVARAEWEPDDSQWKYRVTIQRREGNKLHDFASGFTLRSLQDFAWLEQSLINEFLGGLLLPSLSICLGVADIQNCQHEIDSRLLTNWLSDTLNGVRGQGELQLKLTKVEVATCESMDAFLYQAELDPIDIPKTPVSIGTPRSLKSPRGRNETSNNTSTHNKSTTGAVDMWTSFFPELCYTNCIDPDSSAPAKDVLKTPVNIIKNCSSPALGTDRTFNVKQDSFVEAAMTFDDNTSSFALHSNLLKAERDLIISWRMQSLQGMEKVRILHEQEKHIGAAWKRFAISVSNLFSYEKDMETARLGDSKSRRDLQMPFRKLQKSAVDDCLRILARQKVERSIPSLEIINFMLSAYVADLSTVQPAIQAYLGGLNLLASEQSKIEAMEASSFNPSGIKRQSSSTLADKIQASLNEVKKQLVMKNSDDSARVDAEDRSGKTLEEKRHRQRQHVQMIENRVLMNESLLKDFMTTVCKTATVRTARMMYAYLDKESAQCVALSDAAKDMRSKINVASKESLSKMSHRHSSEIKDDKSTEMKLVNRIVNIGSNTKKFAKDEGDDNVGEEVEKGVELSADLAEEENRKAKLRDAAMEQCCERIGRWDAQVAMKIMEAVGVSDANVRVEETTRDLRMVRKYAIGLKENVERCTEALNILKMSILQSGVGDVRDIRDDLMTEVRNLLSLTFVPPSDNSLSLPNQLLENEGIDLSDPAGWKRNDLGTCGGGLTSYLNTRDSGTEWLLESLSELLKAYLERVEMIESFVYMECVGIQLEKHFSHVRATALTAFEKKTDITSAINIATRKKMPVLVKELQAKLEAIGADVSHTSVKDAKEAHLESKKLKDELHALAMRRLNRAREASTERVIALMTVWAKEEEGASKTEKALMEDLMILVERSLSKEDLEIYLESSPSRTSMSDINETNATG